MGFFGSIRFFSSIKKSKFIAYASNKHLKEGNMPAGEIFDFITKHKDLSRVAREFNATRDDIEHIINGMLGSLHSGVHKGHFTPVQRRTFCRYARVSSAERARPCLEGYSLYGSKLPLS